MSIRETAARLKEAGWLMGVRGVLALAIDKIRFLAARFLLVTLVLAGALTGVLAVLFHRYVEAARDLLIEPALGQTGIVRVLLLLTVPTATFAGLAWLIRRFAPRAVGANLARVRMAYNDNPQILGPRTVAATFVATPLSLGAGAPLGPEGPIVVVASGVSVAIARMLRLPKKVVRAMVPIGVASAISAIFNTPITGVVFALEEVLGTSERGILGGVLVGSVAAAVVERQLLGGRPLLAAPFSTWRDPREMIGFALVGVAAGLTSGLAIKIAHRLKRRWSQRTPSMVKRAAAAGLAIGVAGLIAPEILGVGYDSISYWLHGGSSAANTGLAFVIKLIAFIIAISGGVIGGTFAPSLFLGTALGAAIGHAAHDLFPSIPIDPKAYAVLGMGSFFAGLMRSPIAAVLIVVELTRDYELIVPLMLGVSLAVSISRRISRNSVVEQQMLDEGYIEDRGAGDPLARLSVESAMTTQVATIDRDLTFLEAARRVADSRFHLYPVVNQEGKLEAMLSRKAIDAAIREGHDDDPVRTAGEEPKLVVTAKELLIDVVTQMQLRGIDRCPVIDGHNSRRVIGFLSPSDILRARMKDEAIARDDTFDIFE